MNSKGKYNIRCRLEIKKSKDIPFGYQTDDYVLLVYFNGGNEKGGWTWIPTIDEVQIIKDTLYYLNITQSSLLDRYFKKIMKEKNQLGEIGSD